MADNTTRVRSTAISFLSYDPQSKTLRVTFSDGTVTNYANFPASVYQQFLNSGSKGSFYNSNIRGRY